MIIDNIVVAKCLLDKYLFLGLTKMCKQNATHCIVANCYRQLACVRVCVPELLVLVCACVCGVRVSR